VIGAKLMPARDKLGPQLGVIVDLTVKSNNHASVFIAHGLRRCNVKIDNGETAMAETDLAIRRHPKVSPVWPAMNHGVPHACEHGAIDRACAIR
jgi:hypothetical protein